MQCPCTKSLLKLDIHVLHFCIPWCIFSFLLRRIPPLREHHWKLMASLTNTQPNCGQIQGYVWLNKQRWCLFVQGASGETGDEFSTMLGERSPQYCRSHQWHTNQVYSHVDQIQNTEKKAQSIQFFFVSAS